MRCFSVLRLAFLAAAVAVLPFTRAQSAAANSKDAGPKLGLQTWTCRNMTFDQVVDFAMKHGITQIQFIAAHLDPNGPKEESLRKKAILDQKGLVAYSFGVNKTTMNKEENRKLFEFAKL